MNILISTFSFPFTKQNVFDGRFVYSEALAYSKAGARVRVVTPDFRGADEIENIGKRITVHRFQYFFPRSLQILKVPGVPIYGQRTFLAWCQIPFLCFFFCLAILRHALWADIIHAQWTLGALLSLPAKWFFGKKIVMTARGSDLRLIPKWINQFIHRHVNAAIDCFGPQPWNDKYKKTFSANYIRFPLIVHNDASDRIPRDMAELLCEKDNPFIILYVGRFDFIKISHNNLPIFGLIEASILLRENHSDFHIFFVGDGDEQIKKGMGDLIKENRLSSYFSLLGGKVNVMDYMRFCHLGVGGVAFNAVSQEFTILGIPQMLVDVPDNRYTPWKHGSNAIFIKPNDVNDLTDELSWAITHREKLEQIGKTAKAEMKRYVMESGSGGRVCLDVFERLLARPIMKKEGAKLTRVQN